MDTYVILSHFTAETIDDPRDFPKLAEKVAKRIKAECPHVHWKHSYATMGYFDAVDVIEADNTGEVEKAAMIIRACGHAETQTLPATPWKQFIHTLES